ncbi:MAG: hypothetical protein R2813_06455 [Flavobacteriales bacterium]
MADVPANWSSNNWSTTSNGAPDGLGPPTVAQDARFDANGNGNCTLNLALDTVAGLVLSSYTGTIEFAGNSLRATGTVTLSNGVLSDNSGGSLLRVVSSSTTTFNGTQIGVELDVQSTGVELDGSQFTEYCRFEKTGTGNSNGNGGNVFLDTVILVHSGSANNFLLGNGTPDTFSDFVSMSITNGGNGYLAYNGTGHFFGGNVELQNSATSGGIYFGAASGESTIASGRTLQIGSGGFVNGQLYLREVSKLGSSPLSLTTTGTNLIEFYDCNFSGVVNTTSPRIRTRGTVYQDSVSFIKNGASDDASQGGNRFMDYTHLINTGSGYMMMGNGDPDTFDLDLVFNSTSSSNNYLANNSSGNYVGGNLSVTNSGTGLGGTFFYVSNNTGSTLDVDGDVVAINNGTSADCRIIFGDGGAVDVHGSAQFVNSATGTTSNVHISNNSNSFVSIDGSVSITNTGGTTIGNTYLGNQGDISIGDSLIIENSSSATNSQVYCNHNSNSAATYGGDIILENTNAASDGVFFGNSGGSAVLAAGQIISLSGAFIEGTLQFRNFTQTGATDQTLVLTGNASLILYDSDFGGNIDFEAPSINTRGTVYGGNLTMRKTGAVNDNQAGGNSVGGLTTLTNIGSGYFLWGNGTPDSFANSVTILDSSSSSFYFPYNSAGNYVNGTLVINKVCTGSSTYTRICDIGGSSLEVTGDLQISMASSSVDDRVYICDNGDMIIGGNVDVSNNSGGISYVYLGNANASSVDIAGNLSVTHGSSGSNKYTYVGDGGDIVIGGDLTLNNNCVVDVAQMQVANNLYSSVLVGGVTRVDNDGSGTTRRIYLGNIGDMTFNDSLIILNSSDATNSEVYINHNDSSSNTFSEDILIECTESTNTGIYFGNAGGNGTLAAGQTVSITSNGFVGQTLEFRRFTQVGATAQALSTGGSCRLMSRFSNWGGDVDFDAPRIYLQSSTFGGSAIIEKTGALDDQCPGLNRFTGNATLINSGTDYLMMGNGNPDTFLMDLTMTNMSTDNMFLAYNDSPSYIGGNLTVNQNTTGTGSTFYIANTISTSIVVDGSVDITNDATSDVSNIYLGVQGDISVTGDLSVSNASTNITTSQVIIGNNSNSEVSFDGTVYLENSATGGATSRIYLGNNGDVTVGDSLIIENSSNSTNSEVFCNYDDSSSAIYSGDIVLTSSHTDADGVSFGQSGGEATLAAGQTVSIGAGGFIAGNLFFEQFTQVGGTPQTMLATGTAYMFQDESDWGGNVDFTAPRMRTIDTRYNGTASLSKTGDTDDQSNGGNVFVGNASLSNSGSGYMQMGNGNPDSFLLDLDIVNNGSRHFYLAQSSVGNYVGGNLTVDHAPSGTSASMILGGNDGSLTIDGNVDITNNSTATSTSLNLGDYCDIAIGGDLTIDHAVLAANTNQLNIAYRVVCSVTIGGKTTIDLSGTGNSSQVYFGYQGDITCADSVIIRNASSATASEVGIAYEDSSLVQFNGDLLLESTHADGDGFRFGPGGGHSTLADGQRIVIGPGGYIAGNLHFYNFHQVGNTPQSITTTGTAYIYNDESIWEADLTLSGPRNRTQDSDYGGSLDFQKSGSTDDQSNGGNVVAGTATLINSGSDYMMWGTSTADSFMVDLILQNTGGEGIYVATNGAGHYVGGNVTGSNTGSGSTTWIYVSNGSTASVQIDGDVSIINNGTGTTSQVYVGNSGSATIAGGVEVFNMASATNSYAYIGAGTSSSVSIGGVTRLENSGTGNISRAYLGENGDVVCGDSVYLINQSGSNGSEIYANNSANSSNTYAGDIIVEASTAGCDGVLFGAGNGMGTLAAGQLVSVGSGGFITGQLYFRNFTQTGATPQSITLTGDAIINNYNSRWGGNVNFVAPQFYTYATRYSGTAYFEKTGATANASSGANVVVGAAELVNSGTGYFLMGNGAPDSLMSTVTFTNSGTDNMYFGHNSAGNYIGDDVVVNMSTTGSGTDYFYVSTTSNSTVQIDGDVSITNNAAADDSRIYLGNDGDIDLNGSLSFNNLSTGTSSYAYVATGSNSSVIIDGVARINHAATGSATHRFYLGENGDITFNDSLYITNATTSTNSEFYANRGGNSDNIYNGHIVLECSTAGADGIRFGEGNGDGTISAGNTISIGAGGFTQDQLYLRNMTQLGGTAQSISLGGATTTLSIYSGTWSGDLDFDAPRIYTAYATYNGAVDFEKTGANNDASTGGNTYNGDVVFRNTGTGYFMVPNNVADDYNADLTWVKSSSGIAYPSYSVTSTLAGDLNINANAEITFGANSGRIEFDGAGPQSINDLGASTTPNMRRMTMNKAGDTLTLNMPVEVQTNVTFTDGILASDVTNILRLRDNATVSGVSHASFVQGYVEKVGNDAFTFPVGDSLYRPISISNPSSTSAAFRATYRYENPAPPYTYGANDPPIDHVSTREYWILDRTNLTNNVSVTLSWDVNSGGVDNLSDLLVARWDGDSWVSHGNGGTTGNVTSGTIVSSSAVTSFSPFILASSSSNNPLPIELLDFSATPKDKQVLLHWETASEINNDFFTLERSRDASVFESIGTIPGAGSSNRPLEYQFVDDQPISGVSYYRLKQTDFNGEFEYSGVEQVYLGGEKFVRIGTDLNHVFIDLSFEGEEGLDLLVYDATGSLVYGTTVAKARQQERFLIPQTEIGAAGLYLISVRGASTQFTDRVFIR